MKLWGWMKGPAKQEWKPKNKKIRDFGKNGSEDSNDASHETAILEFQNSATKSLPTQQNWRPSIPSPTGNSFRILGAARYYCATRHDTR